MSTSNREIIAGESMLINYPYNGENLFTFAEWQDRGMKVKKGQHAIITTKLWKPIVKTDKKTGEQDSHFILCKASLFSIEQVEPMSEEFKEFLNNRFHKNIPVTA